ncbi:unnamed protein product [Oikopleura dioica]|uniref:Uncharacterized protein n=1 Tax=Oikopleura dioica TaxID=34765 RepID=E4YXX4_OIKDI|nr:unnamed protein product [Oikopleura dioica]
MSYAVGRLKTSNCPNGWFWTTGFRLSHKRAKSIFSKKNPYLNSSLDIFGLLKNSLVGLGKIDKRYFPKTDRDGIRRISSDNGFEFCYGFAWIVNIDKEKGEILIHSDLTLNELKSLDINCFISANLTLPIDIFFEKEAMKSYPKSKPYLHMRNYDLATANKFKNTQVLKKKTEK